MAEQFPLFLADTRPIYMRELISSQAYIEKREICSQLIRHLGTITVLPDTWTLLCLIVMYNIVTCMRGVIVALKRPARHAHSTNVVTASIELKTTYLLRFNLRVVCKDK